MKKSIILLLSAAAASGQFRSGDLILDGTINTGTTTGSANAYVLTLTSTPALSAYRSGQCFTGIANFTNTGAATINVNAIGARSIVDPAGTSLAAGDIQSGKPFSVCYDGTSMVLMSLKGNNPAGGGGSSNPSKTSYFPWGGTERITNSLGAVSGSTAWIIPVGAPAKMEFAKLRARLVASGGSDGVVFGIYEKTGADTLTLRASTSAVVGNGSAVDVEPAWNSGAWVSSGILTLDPAAAVGEWFFGVGVEGGNFVASAGDALDWIRASSSIWGRTAGGALTGTGTGLTLPATIAPSGLTASTTTSVPAVAFKRF